MSKSSNYELIALSKLTKEFSKELLLGLHPEYFSGPNRQIFKILVQHFAENRRLPTLEALKASVLDKAPRDKLPIITGVFTAISKIDVDNIDDNEVISGLKDKQILTVLDDNIQQLAQSALEKDVSKVREVLSSVVEKVSLQRVSPQALSDAIEQEDESKIVPTFMGGLDDILVGYAGLTIVSAGSGVGKTNFMINTAVQQYLNGYNVLFISLELSAKVFGQRLKSYLTGIDFNKIIKDGTKSRTTGEVYSTLTDEERALIAKTMAEFFDRPNHFRIITSPLDSEELLAMIHVEKALYDIDIAYVDYLNLVGAPKGSNGDGWKNLSDTAKALHRVSMTHGIVTVSASQVNLEKQPKGGSMPEVKTRGSAELIFSATLMLFLYNPPESDDNSVVLYVLKNRNGPTTALLMEKDFSKMRFDYIMPL